MPELGERVTRLEVLVEELVKQISRELAVASEIHAGIERSVAQLTAIIQRQDERLNRIDTTIAKALGAVAVLLIVFQLVAPALRNIFGLTA